MKFFLWVLFLCFAKNIYGQQENKLPNDSILHFLDSYQYSKDTINGAFIQNYGTLGLKLERNKQVFTFYNNNKRVFIGCENKFQYLFQLYRNSYLLITVVKGVSHAAGPETFERDSIFILDLKTGSLKFATLNGVFLVLSEQRLLKNYLQKYPPKADTYKYRFAAIDDIDFEYNKIVILDEYSKKENFQMSDVAEPYSNCDH